MKFQKKLLQGTLLKRYKRFFADVEYVDDSGQKIALTIHCPNTGSLKSVIEKDQSHECWFSLSDDPDRKLKGTLEAVKTSTGAWAGVNTSWPNKIVQEAILTSFENKKPFFKHWSEYSFYKSEHKISKETRLDGVFCVAEKDLENPKAKKHFIEIKNVTLVRDGVAQFPDAETTRGQKHLQELMDLVKEGHKAELIFTIQRNDAKSFAVAEDIDPVYKKLFDQAVKVGVIMTPVLVDLSQDGVFLSSSSIVSY
ncbi:MAG: DNA/RNA nuclease SfsA [Bdellovibrionaceae bacterium]|nr:DNA/RNA nuclease SfsA [Pseudobdellovibrionaceae bacterium]